MKKWVTEVNGERRREIKTVLINLLCNVTANIVNDLMNISI